MIRLHGTALSRANRCLWALEELGLRYEHVPTNFTGESRSADYLKINRNGHVPSLEDDGEVLWESIAINLYLADKYGKDPFWPVSPETRGKCYQWSLWAVNEIERRVVTLNAHRIWNPPERRDAEIVQCTLDELKGPFRILDEHLGTRTYLLGDSFTIADVNVASIARALVLTLNIDLSETPAAERWLKQSLERDSYQRVLAMK
jgi:glutathione S-transferase